MRETSMQKWKPVQGHLGTPRGFRAATVAAGIKKVKGALDLAMIVSDAAETSGAGLFTTNRAAAAPVLVSRHHLAASRGIVRAVVVNSGNANACTGQAGLLTAEGTARAAAKLLDVPPEQVLVASTGVIGVPFELELITDRLPALHEALSVENAEAVTQAIMTTDTFPKSCVLRTEIGGTAVHVAGIAKGAGMIHPRMATMLSFITTDAVIGPRMLQNTLRTAVEVSFNRITVDGDTSTNDTVVAMASGASGITIRPGNDSRSWFLAGLIELCQTLAQMIARDGEGAKKLVTIEVRGARKPSDAELIARAIANSPLVKTAIAGNDPNWGRIICAAGYSGGNFDPTRVDISVNDFALCRQGLDAGFDEAAAKKQFDRKELTLTLDLHQGSASARLWTCDLTHDYITINASYRT
ncbi:MAG: bifunctional glutamate N-acetyltransferase/amino-acid acetyltransferase ArgJ [Acidobacteria bacterium]|nr:bifunctional glutamate N-acetyltransferase/amino-acid acetyltransferase ArgJ [Acidobacteriota bacterium]